MGRLGGLTGRHARRPVSRTRVRVERHAPIAPFSVPGRTWRTASHSGYPDIFPGGIQHNGAPTSFHEYEHSNGFDETVRTGLQYLGDAFGDHLATMQASAECGETLLDHSVVLGTSELSNGWQHRFNDFPFIIAGKGGGALDAGEHIRLEGALPGRVPLTILRALGSEQASFGQEQFVTSEVVGELLT